MPDTSIVPSLTVSSSALQADTASVFMYPTKSPKSHDWGSVSEVNRSRLASHGMTLDDVRWFRETFVGNPFDFNVDSGDGWRKQKHWALDDDRLSVEDGIA
jgi:hypothetical protein